MQSGSVELEGVVGSDGSLIVHEKLSLPPGPVRVTVQPRPQSPSTVHSSSGMTPVEQFWAGTEAIWADLEAHGHVPRTKEEIDAEIRELRDEVEERMMECEHLHSSMDSLDS